MKAKVLVVEDKESLRGLVLRLLAEEGYEVQGAASAEEAAGILAAQFFHVVLTDMRLPGADGLEVLRAAQEADPHCEVVVMTAYGSIESSVKAVKAGAFDYLTKPVENDLLLHTLGRAVEARRLRLENLALRSREGEPDLVVGESPAFRRALETAEKCAAADATVLLLGETGTGKECFARWIHRKSRRADRAFLAVNCAALSPALFESELFGHEKGAFTGADQRRIGRFEAADGGTLFLDEIAEIPPSSQAKLLRVLQDRTFERVGGSRTLRCDVRVVAATNRDLAREVQEGRFREDLYYRLNVVPIRLPSLRERPEDIPALAHHFLARHARVLGKPLALSKAALEVLPRRPWPGNVRELEHALYRAALLARGEVLGPDAFGESVGGESAQAPGSGGLKAVSHRALEEAERESIRGALRESGGNKSQAARKLRVSYKTLLHKIKKLGLG